ncbi:hypothetical protein [Okeania sp. SIO2B3]|nr:hypothetical protein [Okeania sp. SIO2B3]
MKYTLIRIDKQDIMEEGRRKKEEGRGKREEGRRKSLALSEF